ncbi:MAG TPA: TonB-dependent receptor [Vicinamibacterales bacterium]
MKQSLLRAVTLIVCLAASTVAFAQGSTTSTINGTVVDSSGAVLPGATITAKHLGTGVLTTAVSNAQGAFTIPSLPTGPYEVSIALEGFKTFLVKNVVLTAVQGANIKATLEIGGLSETVTVASSSEIIQTQSTTVASTLTTNQITKLPLTSRSAMDFVNFLPGVSTPGGNRNATINGLPQGVINITLDGINVQDNTNRTSDGFFSIVSPRLDAIEEVSVTTAGQGAEAGQGAVQIKFVTRSGTNQYTGSAYHYYRNDALNANTWFNNRSGVEKADLLQNQFGARFGGPLIIPGVLARGKAFFFGNYEELRQPSDTTRNRGLLTPSAIAGNYSYGGRTVNVLALGAANPTTAASSTIDPTIAKLLGDIRSAASSGGSLETLDENVDQFRFNVPVESKRVFPTGRVDFNISNSHRFTSAVNYNSYTDYPDTLNSRDPSFPGFPIAAGQNSKRVSWSNALRSTLGTNLVNEARVGYSGAPVKFFTEMNVGMYTGSVANMKGFHMAFPSVGSALTNPGAAPSPQSRDANDLSIEDTVTWLKGNHNITGGGSWSNFNVWLKNSNLVPTMNFGLITADPAQQVITSAALAAATGVTPSSTQLTAARNLYALLTGRVSSINGNARINEDTGMYEYLGTSTQRSRMQEGGFFLQDSWRLKSNLTINAGVRYTVQLPFTAQNNSYSTTTMEDLCGPSGVGSNGFCNLFQPGVMPGKAVSQFYNLEKGVKAYKTDWDNFAPNLGVAWTPAKRDGLLGALMSDEFVVRGGWARAYSRNGMGDFTGQYSSNPGVSITTNRSEALGNIIPSGASAPLLLRNDALLGAPSFPERPEYPMTDVATSDIRLFDPNIKIPYADSFSAGIQRRLTTNMALEVRYVGTRSSNAWTARNFNEINVYENGFIDEFRLAQANLQANVAAGRGATFAYTGAPGTVPLPTLLAYINGRPASQAGSTASYTGTSWANNTLVNDLTMRNPDPQGLASTLIANFRNNALAAGLPANFFQANPNHTGGAFVTLNSHKTRYNSLQVELRRRLSQGLQFQTSYVFGNAMETAFYTHRRGLFWQRDTGGEGDLTHQFKMNVVYDLPFGQGRRFGSNANGVVDRIIGGWQVGLNGRIQSGQMVDLGGVRLVGWTADDVKKAYKLRFDDAAKQIFMFPADVIENTIRAFSTSNTSATGYSGAAPSGRYFAPANGPDCIEVAGGIGECPGSVRSLVVTGPVFWESDLRVSKRTPIVGRVSIEFAAEALNVFNHANFVPDNTNDSATLTNYLVTGLTGTNTARVLQIVSRINW